MQTSEYDTNDVPPGGGGIISVAIHRNDVIEHYSLTDETVDDNALARNLQAPDIYKWSIVNEDAFPYAESLLLHYAN